MHQYFPILFIFFFSFTSCYPIKPLIGPVIGKELRRRERSTPEKPLKPLLLSSENLFVHLNWGTEEQRLVSNKSTSGERIYMGYGPCTSKWPILYDRHIEQATQLDIIILAYMELFRMHCQDNILEKYMDLFDKGYARLAMDHSISYSNHTVLFIKSKLSFWDIDDLEKLLEFCAFTQVYVSWHKFPVNPIGPLGGEIKDSCFIEVVARLHAIDLIMAVARRHSLLIAYLMGVKLKLVIKMMRQEFKGIKGHDARTKHRRSVAQQCLVVTMALAQFLARKSEESTMYGCAHEAFKAFYEKTEKMFVKIVDSKYGRKVHVHEDAR